MTNFTFKRYPKPSGLAGVAHKVSGIIKLKKLRAGFYRETENGDFDVWLHVKSDDPKDGCGWCNMLVGRLRRDDAWSHSSRKGEEWCREWIRYNSERLQLKYDLHLMEVQYE